jgi:hypothetical protein
LGSWTRRLAETLLSLYENRSGLIKKMNAVFSTPKAKHTSLISEVMAP